MKQDLLSKKKMTKQSTSFDQNKIKVICDKLCDRIVDVLDHFELEHKMNNRFVSMCCPIHGGDNDSALNLYHVGDKYRGNWKCRTHNCDEVFKASIIGFIRGIISRKKYGWTKNGDTTCSFKEALDYATNFLNLSLKDIKISSSEKEKTSFVNNTVLLQKNTVTSNGTRISRQSVRKHLQIPSKYFMDRGFSKEILDKYDVGDCVLDNKEMSNRAVVPIYDMDYKFMVGCSGRSFYNKCDICGSYHANQCPNNSELWRHCKWKHSSGFKTQESLYNFWFAKDHILKSHKIILVESPGNVWRLEENNIHNSVALFGANLSDKQKTLLDISGAMEIIIIMDSDEAGSKARQQIYNKCYRTYNIKNISISKNDIADMTSEEINKEIKALI